MLRSSDPLLNTTPTKGDSLKTVVFREDGIGGGLHCELVMTCESNDEKVLRPENKIPEPASRRRVRFPPMNEGLVNVVGHAPCIKGMWYTANDIRSFQLTTQSKGLSLRNKSCSEFLQIAFAAGDHAFLFPKKKQNALIEWSSTSTCPRGLEAWANLRYAEQKSENQKKVISSVLKAQKLNMTAEEVADASMRYSRASGCFAERMGKADMISLTETATPTRHRIIRRFSLRRKT
mmetsp:Transcript_1228/g.1791  ORF Transcript_1228/g.1791 Transcript_1228/m.1791 type:complete len:234 (+) Transcript_1228:159-860(+)